MRVTARAQATPLLLYSLCCVGDGEEGFATARHSSGGAQLKQFLISTQVKVLCDFNWALTERKAGV